MAGGRVPKSQLLFPCLTKKRVDKLRAAYGTLLAMESTSAAEAGWTLATLSQRLRRCATQRQGKFLQLADLELS